VIDRLSIRLARALEPETAHDMALRALRLGLFPATGVVTSPRLRTRLMGLDLPNPLGLAAGFDKNGVAIDACQRLGFGHVEVGAVTPLPQPGNPRPRVFRLVEDRALINRFGFNNAGLDALRARLQARRGGGVVGVNIGANKESADRVADYVTLVEGLNAHVDYLCVNVSSPNTPGLRGLQDAGALDALLGACMAVATRPVALKIAPDLDDAALADIVGLARKHGVAAIAATNTTSRRDGLSSAAAKEMGGLSGRPLRARATEVVRALRRETAGEIALIGIGGIDDAASALERLRAGADAVQLYTAMVYGGLGLPARLLRDLDALLAREGFESVADAVGVDA
jgi:dihydroorotate dehydrogenase